MSSMTPHVVMAIWTMHVHVHCHCDNYDALAHAHVQSHVQCNTYYSSTDFFDSQADWIYRYLSCR